MEGGERRRFYDCQKQEKGLFEREKVEEKREGKMGGWRDGFCGGEREKDCPKRRGVE